MRVSVAAAVSCTAANDIIHGLPSSCQVILVFHLTTSLFSPVSATHKQTSGIRLAGWQSQRWSTSLCGVSGLINAEARKTRSPKAALQERWRRALLEAAPVEAWPMYAAPIRRCCEMRDVTAHRYTNQSLPWN